MGVQPQSTIEAAYPKEGSPRELNLKIPKHTKSMKTALGKENSLGNQTQLGSLDHIL